MATADEILAAALNGAEGAVLEIDNDLRTITIPESVRILGVESDDDVRRLHFRMPQTYGEFDLSGFSARINYINANGGGDVYRVTDAAADGEYITFSWLVGRFAAQYKGSVKFIVCLKRSEDGEVVQEFNTTVASLPVLEGLETSAAIEQAYPDAIEAMLLRLDKLEQGGTGGGVGIASLEQTTASTEDGGANIWTVTLTDGTTSTLTVRNGSKGSTGATGPQGEKGETGAQGPQGEKGETGAQGPAGADGTTPVKGVDYFTDADKAGIVSDVLAALPTWGGGAY